MLSLSRVVEGLLRVCLQAICNPRGIIAAKAIPEDWWGAAQTLSYLDTREREVSSGEAGFIENCSRLKALTAPWLPGKALHHKLESAF